MSGDTNNGLSRTTASGESPASPVSGESSGLAGVQGACAGEQPKRGNRRMEGAAQGQNDMLRSSDLACSLGKCCHRVTERVVKRSSSL